MKNKKKQNDRPTLKKSDILEAVRKKVNSNEKYNFKKNEIEAIITALEEEIKSKLVHNDIRLPNFLKLEVHKASARVIRRPITQNEKRQNKESPLIKVPEKAVIKVKLGKKFKKFIQETVNVKKLG